MPFCDQCGAENPDWARFCDQCGNRLIPVNAPEAAAPAQAAANNQAADAAAADVTACAQCGAAFIPGQAFCDECGAPLLSPTAQPQGSMGSGAIPPQNNYPAPQPVGLPPAQPAPPPRPPEAAPAKNVATAPFPAAAPQHQSFSTLQIVIPTRNVSLPLPASNQVLIGRADAVSGIFPDIDLTPYGGIESGVGRRHLLLTLQGGQVYAEDQDSTNGSFVNGKRLAPKQPQPVHSGDELRLGTLVVKLQG